MSSNDVLCENKYFLTDSLYLDNGYFFFELNNDFVKVNKKNFTEAFSLYGWEDIDYLWETQLGNNYLILDCGSNGDCLFHCISEALNLKEIYKVKDVNNIKLLDISELRKVASDQINDENFNIIMESYKLEYELGEFQGQWDPVEMLNKKELQNEIRKPGNNFWGDHIIIQLLSKALKINFIILNSDDDDDSISFTYIDTNEKCAILILYYENKCHYKLVGKFDGKKMQVIFNKIPKYILELNKV